MRLHDRAFVVSVLLCLFCFALPIGRAVAGRATVVGYYPDWNRSAYPHTAIAYNNLTHIAHAFLIPNSDGSISGTTGFGYPGLVQAAHGAGVKVVVALGGWGGSGGFSPMAADSASRGRFVSNILSFCLTNGYDGVDLDWEYPANTSDRSNLTVLVHEMRRAFSASSAVLSISLAIPAGDWSGRWFDVGAMKDDVDWFGVMTYDFYGGWTSTSGPNSPLYGNGSPNNQGWIDNSYTYYAVTRSLLATKFTIGIPFYGQVFNSATMYGASTGAAQKTYSGIVPYLTQGWTRYWDTIGLVPYLINPGATQVISYDDSTSVALKCSYAMSKGVQGAIIWAIGQDYANGEQPLLDVVGRGFGLVTGADEQEGTLPPLSFRLEQCYPNPFNPVTVIPFETAEEGVVRLAVYDLLGREVAELVNGRIQPGRHTVQFDGTRFSSGVYFYRFESAGSVMVRRMVLAR